MTDTPDAAALADELADSERVQYEERILAAEMKAVRLSRLVRQPEDRGGYRGDTFYPVGGTEASHEWDGERWNWLPGVDPNIAALRAKPAGEAASNEPQKIDPYWTNYAEPHRTRPDPTTPILHAPGCPNCDFFRANDAERKAMEARIAAHNEGSDDD